MIGAKGLWVSCEVSLKASELDNDEVVVSLLVDGFFDDWRSRSKVS